MWHRVEARLDRLKRYLYYRFLSICHPELDVLEDEDDRFRAVMLAGLADPRSGRAWFRWLMFSSVTMPVAAAAGAVLAAHHGYGRGPWMVLYAAAGAVLGSAPCAVATFASIARTRRYNRRLLSSIGHSTCPHCGYDLSGHEENADACPECGCDPRRESA